jgi:hypothetical protein
MAAENALLKKSHQDLAAVESKKRRPALIALVEAERDRGSPLPVIRTFQFPVAFAGWRRLCPIMALRKSFFVAPTHRDIS